MSSRGTICGSTRCKPPYLASNSGILTPGTPAGRAHAAAYTHALEGVGDLQLPRVVTGDHVFHLYVIRTQRRDALQTHLNQRGIATVIHYPVPMHLQAAYADLGYSRGAFPITERLSDEILSLPMYAELTAEQQDYVIKAVKDFFA
jgi:dTDP-4-amino-4,6-dideoxygalactose transaminase